MSQARRAVDRGPVPAPRSLTHTVLWALGAALVYAAAVALGRATRVTGSEIALIWPAAAVAVLWVSHARATGRRSVLVANCALLAVVSGTTSLATGSVPSSAIWFAVVNLTLAVATAILLTGREARPPQLRDPGDLARLLLATAGGSLIAATMATGYFAVTSSSESLHTTFAMFAVRNGVAILAGVAVAIKLRDSSWTASYVSKKRLLEGIAAVGFAAVTLVAVFWVYSDLPLAFVSLVPAMWIALRYSTTVSTVFLLAAGVFIVWTTLVGHGFDVDTAPMVRALLAQCMVGSLTCVVLALALFRDSRAALVAELEAAEARALADADFLAGVLDAATEQSIIGTDPTGIITAFNHGAELMLGWERDEMIGRNATELHLAAELEARSRELGVAAGFTVFSASAQRGRADVREWTYVRRDGTRLDVSLAVTATAGPDGEHTGYIGVATDITARKRAEADLQWLALNDPLTGLANRAHFMSELRAALTAGSSTRTGLVYLDLNGFKLVNDGWGHAEGDRLLVEVGDRLTRIAGDGPTVARLGGDEFAVLCRDVDEAELDLLARRINEELARPYELADGQLFDGLSASLGTALGEPDSESTALIERADQRMYAAKRARRARHPKPTPEVLRG
ncbi:diguanylate cyclase [Nocardioides dubius]|uniref:PAS domain S-box-containing protein/diguanylate cyclase (GGDEF) domain-containing protein n=1 Tax=Nocardioides dubius TaxID=317019 RepID=A0ABN1TUP3_9ACTN